MMASLAVIEFPCIGDFAAGVSTALGPLAMAISGDCMVETLELVEFSCKGNLDAGVSFALGPFGAPSGTKGSLEARRLQLITPLSAPELGLGAGPS